MQGEDNAPNIVQSCLNRWRELNPKYSIEVYCLRDIQQCLVDVGGIQSVMTVQAKSDIFRLWLLRRYGGIWVDATTMPALPLDHWLPRVSKTGFFAFRGHLSPLEIDSYFLASAQGHPLVSHWWDETRRYWNRPRKKMYMNSWLENYSPGIQESIVRGESDVHPYYWVMHLFKRVLATEQGMQDVWSAVPRIDGGLCHSLQLGLVKGSNGSLVDLIRIASSSSPLELAPLGQDELKAIARMAPIQKLARRLSELPVDWDGLFRDIHGGRHYTKREAIYSALRWLFRSTQPVSSPGERQGLRPRSPQE